MRERKTDSLPQQLALQTATVAGAELYWSQCQDTGASSGLQDVIISGPNTWGIFCFYRSSSGSSIEGGATRICTMPTRDAGVAGGGFDYHATMSASDVVIVGSREALFINPCNLLPIVISKRFYFKYILCANRYGKLCFIILAAFCCHFSPCTSSYLISLL